MEASTRVQRLGRLTRLRNADVPEPMIVRMMGQNAPRQFGLDLARQAAA
jgi:hypothetical protein